MATTPSSPQVTIDFTNNNVYPSVPLLGVSHIVAVTEEGPYNDPSDLIYNIGQFRSKFGSETLPDGSISNIEIALRMGSILRISRVDNTTPLDLTKSEAWIKALEAFGEYSDAYQLACSGINQHIITSTELDKVHIAAADMVDKSKEVIYYIEVPKFKTGVEPNDDVSMVEWATALIAKVKNSPYIALFGGGWKYYDTQGVLKDCDTIGTVIGLGDASASSFGPWASFAGQNRGLVTDARGLVIKNYGSPFNYPKLDNLAKSYINVSVIKDTKNYGKQPMLWHNFTTSLGDTSERYLGVVRLILYLKKILRPVLESYLEEPNTFSTWWALFKEVEPKLKGLKDRQALVEYEWIGDQYATNFNELTVNNEADVRIGKYVAVLKFKEIVALQDIHLNLSIDATSSSVDFAMALSSGDECYSATTSTVVTNEENDFKE